MKPGDRVILKRDIHRGHLGDPAGERWPAGIEVVVREVTPQEVAVSWLGHPRGPSWTVVGREDVRASGQPCCSSCAHGLPCGSTEKLKKELRQGARSPQAEEVRRRIAQMPSGPVQRRARELLLQAVPAPSRVESLVRQVLAPAIAHGSKKEMERQRVKLARQTEEAHATAAAIGALFRPGWTAQEVRPKIVDLLVSTGRTGDMEEWADFFISKAEGSKAEGDEAEAPQQAPFAPLPGTAKAGIAYFADLGQAVVLVIPGSSARRRADLVAALEEVAAQNKQPGWTVDSPRQLQRTPTESYWQGAFLTPRRNGRFEIAGPREDSKQALRKRKYDVLVVLSRELAPSQREAYQPDLLYLPVQELPKYGIGDRVVTADGRMGTVIATCLDDQEALTRTGKPNSFARGRACQIRYDLNPRQRSVRRHTETVLEAELSPDPAPPPREQVLTKILQQGDLSPRVRPLVENELRARGLIEPVDPPLHDAQGGPS